MTHDAPSLTGPQLLALAQQEGRAITPVQFKRWRLEGLLPLAVRKGRGQARGIEGRYSPSVLPQLLAVADALADGLNLDAARFRLWWRGYEVDDDRIRESLVRVLDDFRDARRLVQRVRRDDATSEAFEQAANKRLYDPTLARIRRRLGKRTYPTFLMLLHELVAGEFTGNDKADVALITRGFGATTALVDAQGGFAFLRELFRSQSLRDATLTASVADLVEARNELKPVLARLQALSPDDMVSAWGVATPRTIVDILAQVAEAEFMQFLVLWLGARQDPRFRRVYEYVMPWLSRPVSEWPREPIPSTVFES